MEIIVELVTRNQKVLSSQKVDASLVTIGRAFDNNIVLHDEHVCPHHAEIHVTEENRIVLNNKDSVNGIRDIKNKVLSQHIDVESGDMFAFGKVFIRIFRLDHQVEPTKKLSIFEDISNFANQWFIALALAVVVFCGAVYLNYISSFEDVIWSKLFAKSVGTVLALTILPGIITLFTWLFKREIKFFTATSFSFFFVCIAMVYKTLMDIVVFNVGQPTLLQILNFVVDNLLIVAFLWGVFYLVTNMSQKKITVVSFSLVILITGLTYLNNQSDKVQLKPLSNADIYPSSFLIASPITAEEYSDDLSKQFDAALKEAERRNNEALE